MFDSTEINFVSCHHRGALNDCAFADLFPQLHSAPPWPSRSPAATRKFRRGAGAAAAATARGTGAAAAAAAATAAAAAPAPPRALTEEEIFARKSVDQLNAEKPLDDVFFDLDKSDDPRRRASRRCRRTPTG